MSDLILIIGLLITMLSSIIGEVYLASLALQNSLFWLYILLNLGLGILLIYLGHKYF